MKCSSFVKTLIWYIAIIPRCLTKGEHLIFSELVQFVH